jgi:hypothetical protein
MLALGIGATIAGNMADGISFGIAGAIISAWPALAFVGSAEMALGMVRASHEPVLSFPEIHRAFSTEIADGCVPTIREIKARLSAGQQRAEVVQTHIRQMVAV